MKTPSFILLNLIVLFGIGCSSVDIEQAKQTITIADSLEIEGLVYADSLTLAEAVELLEPYRFAFPNEYSRALYHYRKVSNADNECDDEYGQLNVVLLVAFVLTFIILSVFVLYEIVRHKYRKDFLFRHNLIVAENAALVNHSKQLVRQQIVQIDNRFERILDALNLLNQSDDILKDLQWSDYDILCDNVNQYLFLLANKLKATNVLNEKEIRLCVLVVLGKWSDKEMAEILFYSDKTIRSTKRKVAQKLNTTSAKLRQKLFEMALK